MFTAILLIICCGQLMVTTVITAEAMGSEETQSRTLSPSITGYKSHDSGRYWTDSQCPDLDPSHQNSVDACVEVCARNGNCTAFSYSTTYQSCSLFACSIPAPEPTGSFSGLVAYSNKADCSFNNQQYTDGSIIMDQKACAQLKCDGDIGQFTFLGYDDACWSCMSYWDPHIMTYDQSRGGSCDWEDPDISSTDAEYCGSFGFQKCGKFSLTQSDNSYGPKYAVYATFVQCSPGGSYTCVGTVHLKNDDNTNVAVVYENDELKIQVNGIDVNDDTLSSSVSLLQVSQTVYPVLAWTSTYNNYGETTSCVNLQGSSGFLVRYCGDPYNYVNTVVVLAHPDVARNGVQGLCGNANDNVYDDLTTRDGNNIHIWERETMTRWQASANSGNGSCPSSRISRITQNICELDPSVQDGFFNQCETAIKDGLSKEEINLEKILIDDCVYDLCNVTDPATWMETVKATVQVRAEIQKDTRDSLITTIAPTEPPTQPPTQQTTKNCSFNNQQYTNGSIILDQKACAQLKCDGDTGQFTFLGYDDACWSCMSYWDPHILTYDQIRGGSCDWEDPDISSTDEDYCGSFGFQKCGKFSLTQNSNSYDPTYAVYATFVQCEPDGYYTCVGTVHFKNDENTNVEVVYENDELKIQVNGKAVNDDTLSSSVNLLQVSQTVYPVLAWTSTYNNYGETTNCVNLQGSSGLLVRYCGDPYNYANTVVVLAHPDIVRIGDEELQGLCGNANDNVYDDLTIRDGSSIHIWERATMTRWQASENSSDGSCPSSRISRMTQNRCELDPSVRDGFFNQCETTIKDGLSKEETNIEKILINDCVYDLCNVTDPATWMETVKATVQVQAEMQINTVESLITTKAPTIQTTQRTSQPPTEPTTQPPTEDRCGGNEGWRGKCFGTQNDLSNYTKCDSLIKNATGCEEGKTCCVDCSLLTDLCENKWTGSVARGSPCPRCERKLGEIRLGSGCSCCKKCKRTQKCKKRNGICISDEDPVHNRGWCEAREGKIKKEWCKGDGCFCCVLDRT